MILHFFLSAHGCILIIDDLRTVRTVGMYRVWRLLAVHDSGSSGLSIVRAAVEKIEIQIPRDRAGGLLSVEVSVDGHERALVGNLWCLEGEC